MIPMANGKRRSNDFYTEFDLATYKPRREDYRTPFEKDRDRVLHTSAFRRLQAKTQVFISGDYDFYRTRLTHSLEVAQIGRSICNYLNRTSGLLNENTFYIDPDLVEAVCLAHDIGHPPFGHSGERKLNSLMKQHGGFEGNAQTARLLFSIIYSTENGQRGLSPTRSFLDGTLKYKALYSKHNFPSKHFLYDSQQEILDFLFPDVPIDNSFEELKEINSFRSIECRIMDWADDIAYSVNDVSDGIRAGFLTVRKIEAWFERQDEVFRNLHKDVFDALINAIQSGNFIYKAAINIGDFIESCTIEETETPMSPLSNRYRYKLKIAEQPRSESGFYKKLATDIIFHSPIVQQLEYKSEMLIEKIFNLLVENYVGKEQPAKTLVPQFHETMIINAESEEQQYRLICDYIAGMTDDFAMKIYNRLFQPGFGSITDLV